ncbi:unnamed protein product [Mucor hiemalis]
MLSARYGRVGLLVLLPICLIMMIYYGINNNSSTYKKKNKYPPYEYDYKYQNDHSIKRENAAFVVLARNSDLNGLRESMQMMEDNSIFKEWTTGLSSGKTYYGELTKKCGAILSGSINKKQRN